MHTPEPVNLKTIENPAETPPMTTQPKRRSRARFFQAGLGLAAIAFGVLTFLVRTTPAFALDLEITRALQALQWPGLGFWMNAISWPGFSPQVLILTVLILGLLVGLGLRWEAVLALFAAACSSGINLLVKDLVQRPRPAAGLVQVLHPLQSYSFPSGHVMYYLGFLGFLGFLVFYLLKASLKRSLLLVLIAIPISLIGPSRIYLGEHWASDVLGSYLLGSLILAATIQIYRWGKPRFFVQPTETNRFS
jgi:membrane-associated phospholipid phosphatase